LLLTSSALNVAFWAVGVADSNRVGGIVAIAFAFTIFLAGAGALLLAVSPAAAVPRRMAMINLSLTALLAAMAALTLSILIDGDPSSRFPWMSRFSFGVFVAALLLALVPFWKSVRLEMVQEPVQEPAPFDPFDPEEPPDEMIEPDPLSTLGVLLARKRSLNLARAR